MHVIYQQPLCGSLSSSFFLSGWHYAPFIHACFFFCTSGSLFLPFFPCLFLPKCHTIPYPRYHFVLFSLCYISAYFLLLTPSTPHCFFTCFLSRFFYYSKTPSHLVSYVFGIIRPVYSRCPPHLSPDVICMRWKWANRPPQWEQMSLSLMTSSEVTLRAGN